MIGPFEEGWIRRDESGDITHLLVARWSDGASFWRLIRSASRPNRRENIWFIYYDVADTLPYQGHRHAERFFWYELPNMITHDRRGDAGPSERSVRRLSWILPRIGICDPDAGWVGGLTLPGDDDAGSTLFAEEALEMERLLGNELPYTWDDTVLRALLDVLLPK